MPGGEERARVHEVKDSFTFNRVESVDKGLRRRRGKGGGEVKLRPFTEV